MQKQAKVSKTDEGREKKKGSDTESDSSSSESDSGDDSSSSSSSFSEDEDDAETCDKNFLESGLLRLPEELAFFGSKSHWCKRLAPLIDKLRNSALPLDERYLLPSPPALRSNKIFQTISRHNLGDKACANWRCWKPSL